MKHLLTILICLTLTLTLSAQIKTDEKKVEIDTETGDTTFTESVIITSMEDITPRGSMLIINPLKFFIFYNLSYFHKISDKVTLGAGFQVPTVSGVSGFGINAEARIYPTGKQMRGFYIAPNISYNSLDEYAASMREALTHSYPAYEEIGVEVNGDYRQLNTAILQIENEFYGTVRPKRPILPGERPLIALEKRGVEYVEVRCLDLNPFLPLGIDSHQNLSLFHHKNDTAPSSN